MSTNQPVVSPLNESHYSQIVSGLAILDALQPELDKAKRAGIDVSEAQQTANDNRSKLLQLKNVYFPGR